MSRMKQVLCTLAAALALAACGGGGGGGIGGTGGGGGGGGGIGGTGISYGTITAFGSVWVNGVEFSTSNSSIRLDDGSSSTQAGLRIGMLVRVEGDIPNKTAASIAVDDSLKGRVESVLDDSRIVVMGQTVRLDDSTQFEGGTRPALGDFVQVHGQVAADGTLAAGYVVKPSASGTLLEAKGIVRNHDSATQSFTLGTLTVRYSGATTGDMPAGSWNGLVVEAKGSQCSGVAPAPCGSLTATKVEPTGPNLGSSASFAQAEVEGFVTSLASASDFTVNNQRIVTTASTRFEGGTAADLLVGVKLEAEGSVSGGVLTATKVSLRDGLRIEGNVASVNAAAGTFTVAGLPGITVKVNPFTEWKGGATTLAALAAPNHLRIRGRLAAGNTLVAVELERRSTAGDARVELQAPLAAVAAPSLTLLGLVVDTSGISNNSFLGLDDAVLGRTGFFAAVKVNTLVKLRGSLGGASVSWSEVQLESD